eukprot:TRINITY_DN806_c0_g1_i1.p1 TRINITY_DN806_c0_g1~~TRINITY_DN806_c0_g1_i1.p1  ORF type:complete len:299 (-),score=74.76 TRINITY_DN806_c0_g1_i1:12-908(-)
MASMDFLSAARPKWGDEEEDDTLDFSQEITTETIPDVDGSVRKTVVEYKTNDKGQRVKVIKKIKMYKKQVKVNKRVEERKKWKKFGDCANAKGIESGVTSVGDETYIDLVSTDQDQNAGPKPKDTVNLGIVCRNCGKVGDHWTLKCPYFKTGAVPSPGSMPPAEDPRIPDRPAAGGGDGKYVPPSMRRGGNTAGSTPDVEPRGQGRRGAPSGDDAATIRVTNLSEDTKESDLNELFRSFGPISRIFLAKDKQTNLSKGFAFINFVYREDAAKAIDKLSGKFGYDHLILHLEWAKPSNK